MIILGTFVRAASVKSKYYEKALRIRALLISKMKEILKDSYILSPTMPIKTPRFSEATKLSPYQTYMMDILTVPPNLGGFPHISFPYDYVDSMPLGAQLVSDHFDDYSLISFTEKWEESFDYKFPLDLGDI